MFPRAVFLLFTVALAAPSNFDSHPYAQVSRRANESTDTTSALVKDLGYSIYEGSRNESAQLDVWQGIRYAQDTGGQNRWQPPRTPLTNRSSIIQADGFPKECPQAPDALGTHLDIDNSENSEDCLYLSVFAPTEITDPEGLPVMVWIHGGGYGQGGGGYDMTPLVYTNNNRFLVVSIQYRLGAFGFLSSDEVYRKGVPNAGILDQQMALHWVQQYIGLFGGNPRKVTICGESAGGGSVMLHDMAYGGTLGTQLFRNSISSSPYLPFQYGYKDWQPSQAYYAFAAAAGCDVTSAYLRNGSQPIFDCLVSKDYITLANANANISQSGTLSTWAFLPVTDGRLIQDTPSKQLAEGRVNGLNHLAGHNALEGASWVTQTIETIDDLVDYLRLILPNFSNNDVAKTLMYYPISTGNASTDFDAPLWATEGDSGVTNLEQSTAATGQQERAIAIYGEVTLICPSYWLAEAYSDNALGGQGWKYQFSIPNAYHGTDGAGFVRWPDTGGYYSPDYIRAFMTMLGNFIVGDDPSIASEVANGLSTGNATAHPLSSWPPYSIYQPLLADFNTTCPAIEDKGGLPYCTGPGQTNTFRLADAYTWEGGRGKRCDFWRMMGAKAPV
ncbi:carboxylesterase [Xylariomycetidae sp. FL2044]|nr:carboxylesterase [Xylariomycetidae sp. FL2044]